MKIRMKRCKCRKEALYSWFAARTFATLITIHEDQNCVKGGKKKKRVSLSTSFIFLIKVRGLNEFADLRTVTGGYPVLDQPGLTVDGGKTLTFEK